MDFMFIFHPRINNARICPKVNIMKFILVFKALTTDGTNSHINSKPFNSGRGIVILFVTVNNCDFAAIIETLILPDL